MNQTIINRYKSGEATIDIANSLGIHRRRIIRILKKNNIQLINTRYRADYCPHNKQPISNDDIRRLHSEGLSTPEMAQQLECSRTLLIQRFKSLGLSANRFWFREATNLASQIGELAYYKLSDVSWLREQYVVQNRTTRSIAAELGCGKKAVSGFLRRHNIPIKRTRRGIFSSKSSKCKQFWYDSFWEKQIAEKLDIDDQVQWFIKEPFPLLYFDGTRMRNYFPDFLVILRDRRYFLIEIKPNGLLPYVEAKIQVGKDSGIPYFVMTDEDKFPW